jgi:hypothetical protein
MLRAAMRGECLHPPARLDAHSGDDVERVEEQQVG